MKKNKMGWIKTIAVIIIIIVIGIQTWRIDSTLDSILDTIPREICHIEEVVQKIELKGLGQRDYTPWYYFPLITVEKEICEIKVIGGEI